MDGTQLISLYSTLFYVSMALCVVGFALAIGFFFLFDIPKVFTQVTGRGKEKLARQSKEANTTRSRRDVSGVRSTELYTAQTVPPAEEGSTTALSGEIGAGPERSETAKTQQLTGDLQGQTSTLAQQKPEKLPEDSYDPTLTATLSSEKMPAPPRDREEEERTASVLGRIKRAKPKRGEETGVLGQQTLPGRFEITQSVIEIHTDEMI